MKYWYRWRLRVWEARLGAAKVEFSCYAETPFTGVCETEREVKMRLLRKVAATTRKVVLIRGLMPANLPSAEVVEE